jgi:hypothetical protein
MGIADISWLLILAFVILLGITGYFSVSALEQIRPLLPIQFRDPLASRYAFDAFVWNTSMPASARRNYMISLIAATTAAGCIAGFMFLQGPIGGALVFAGVFILTAALTLTRSIKYRNRLSA